jgi:nucleotide-binding universal stress UspA family protein
MALKDLLVCIDADVASDARVKLAFSLARAYGAHLAGAYVIPQAQSLVAHPPAGVIPPGGITEIGGTPIIPGTPLGEVRREAELAESAEEHFRDELRINGTDGEWHLLDAGEEANLIELAKTFDLTIIGQLSPDSGTTAFRPEEIAMAAARPVLVIPYAGTFKTVCKRALVAWDGSREAVRAVNDALPLLADAEAVTVISVGARETEFERHQVWLDRIVAHLKRHGIAGRPEQTVRGDVPISDILLSRAADLGADLIVAGAYHHSQLRESLLGGVSRELLEHMTVPVLMSH